MADRVKPENMNPSKEVVQLRRQAQALRERADELEHEAFELYQKEVKKLARELQDKQLNRTQCLDYLPITTLQGLKNWENRYRPYGYLQFEDNTLLRSELLRFIDDKQTGKIARMIRER